MKQQSNATNFILPGGISNFFLHTNEHKFLYKGNDKTVFNSTKYIIRGCQVMIKRAGDEMKYKGMDAGKRGCSSLQRNKGRVNL